MDHDVLEWPNKRLRSPLLKPGQKWTWVARKPGKYNLECTGPGSDDPGSRFPRATGAAVAWPAGR